MMTKEVMKQALEALTATMSTHGFSEYIEEAQYKAIKALKEALNQDQEPVAFASHGVINWIADKQFQHEADLYTTPPQRTWVGLTDEKIEQLHIAWVLGGGFRQLCNAIEETLKENNK